MRSNPTYRSSPSTFSLSGILRDVVVSWKLLLDPAVPGLLKLLLPIGALIYWISPLDLIPGMPFDDLAILLIAARFFVSLAPRDSVHRAYGGNTRGARTQQASDDDSVQDNEDDVIDTTWRIVDD